MLLAIPTEESVRMCFDYSTVLAQFNNLMCGPELDPNCTM